MPTHNPLLILAALAAAAAIPLSVYMVSTRLLPFLWRNTAPRTPTGSPRPYDPRNLRAATLALILLAILILAAAVAAGGAQQ